MRLPVTFRQGKYKTEELNSIDSVQNPPSEMKLLVLLSLFLVAVYGISPELETLMKTELKRMGTECMAELSVSEDDIEPLLKHSPPKTYEAKCFLACINKKSGVQDSSGKVKSADDFLEKIKLMDEDYYTKAKHIVDVCIVDDHNQDDECETANSLYTCVLEEKSKLGLPMISLD
ncbi:general odorant-binding protein 19d-like [Photinus pyralis]|uniref:general odorant-binding protein 19d-like n=1 Tax=Photinus pyralis TaxID=7054 RepID=UPI0012675A1C|nr:general odorant-binding protein 19d-like [Photinus pyralis]